MIRKLFLSFDSLRCLAVLFIVLVACSVSVSAADGVKCSNSQCVACCPTSSNRGSSKFDLFGNYESYAVAEFCGLLPDCVFDRTSKVVSTSLSSLCGSSSVESDTELDADSSSKYDPDYYDEASGELVADEFASTSSAERHSHEKHCVESEPHRDAAKKLTVIERIECWYDSNMSYVAIMSLMAVESSFIPFPSEIVVPPAAYVAAKEDSSMNVALVVLFATLGALIGALVNYFLSMWLGRPIIYKFADSKVGHLLLLSSAKVQKAEDYFNAHGKVSTFVGRLIPGIRQLISIPAGLSKMPLLPFMLFTLLGAGIWNVVLAAIGYIAQGQSDLIKQYSHELSLILLALLGIAVVWFVVKWFIKKNKTVE